MKICQKYERKKKRIGKEGGIYRLALFIYKLNYNYLTEQMHSFKFVRQITQDSSIIASHLQLFRNRYIELRAQI